MLERPGQKLRLRTQPRRRPQPDAPGGRFRQGHPLLQGSGRGVPRVGRTGAGGRDGGQKPRPRAGGPRRRHHGCPRTQHPPGLAQGRAHRGQLPGAHQRPLPVRGRRRARAGCGHVPHPARQPGRRRPVGGPSDAQGPIRSEEARLHHPARRRTVRGGAVRGAQRQQALPGRVAGTAGAAVPRRPFPRDDQQHRAQQGQVPKARHRRRHPASIDRGRRQRRRRGPGTGGRAAADARLRLRGLPRRDVRPDRAQGRRAPLLGDLG